MNREVDESDLNRIMDALLKASEYFEKLDEMDAALHLSESVRYSPLTTEVCTCAARLDKILKDSSNIVDM